MLATAIEDQQDPKAAPSTTTDMNDSKSTPQPSTASPPETTAAATAIATANDNNNNKYENRENEKPAATSSVASTEKHANTSLHDHVEPSQKKLSEAKEDATDVSSVPRMPEEAVVFAAIQEAVTAIQEAVEVAENEGVAVGVAAAAKALEQSQQQQQQNANEEEMALAAIHHAATMVLDQPPTSTPHKKRKFESTSTSTSTSTTTPPASTLTLAVKKQRQPPTRVSWDHRLQQLAQFKAQHGSLLIPIRYKLNPSLGKFVHNTREQYKLYNKQTPEGYKKKCSLTAERIQQLETLGFVWSTQRTHQQELDWKARYEQLVEFKKNHGHCLVPHGYATDPSFAEWIHRQRTTYASMNNNNNTTTTTTTTTSSAENNLTFRERMDMLQQLGFNFTVHSDKWTDHWHLLKAYRDKHGDCQVPTHYPVNPKLGRWVHTQRHQRRLQSKGKKSCMTTERIAGLDQLGFSWEVRACLERPRATWQQRLEELADYHQQHGHFLIPLGSGMPQLHAWCWEQNQKLQTIDQHGTSAAKRMGPERVQALKAIGFTKDVELAGPPPVPVQVQVQVPVPASVPPPPKVKQESANSPWETTPAKSSQDKATRVGETDDGAKDYVAAPVVKEEPNGGPADDIHQVMTVEI